jgi:hypothetical protein
MPQTFEQSADSREPWFRNPWVWLLIAIPSLTVAGCMLTIYLAVTNPHVVVSDTPPAPTAGSIAAGSE